MKRLFTSGHGVEVEFLKGILDEAGIACEVRNANFSNIYHTPSFDPELWVVNDDDFPNASDLISQRLQAAPAAAERPEVWTCPGCGEQVDAAFDRCIGCGARNPAVALAKGEPSPEAQYRRLTLAAAITFIPCALFGLWLVHGSAASGNWQEVDAVIISHVIKDDFEPFTGCDRQHA